MKRFRNIKKHLIPVCMVLAFALLLGLTLNLYEPFKRLTQKKAVNPDNLLLADEVVWESYITKSGVTFERNDDGSWHIYGKSDSTFEVTLTLCNLNLTAGNTYMLSSGMEHCGAGSFFLALKGSNGNSYVGDLDPEYDAAPATRNYGAFEASSGLTYKVIFVIKSTGAVIDEVVYPCLVEGAEPADFYIYK